MSKHHAVIIMPVMQDEYQCIKSVFAKVQHIMNNYKGTQKHLVVNGETITMARSAFAHLDITDEEKLRLFLKRKGIYPAGGLFGLNMDLIQARIHELKGEKSVILI